MLAEQGIVFAPWNDGVAVSSDRPFRAAPSSWQQAIESRRVLFVSYGFPPVGGAGVQRTAKFVKYLQRFGWSASVLTVANPSVPLFDRSLLEDIPKHTLIRKARTWEPGYSLKSLIAAGNDKHEHGLGAVRGLIKHLGRKFVNGVLQPDPQALWIVPAIREGRRFLRETPHAAIVASGPPFSTFLIGAALSGHARIPLVLDYRDEWNLSNAYLENRRPGFFSRLIQQRMQNRVVRAASALIATTQASAQALEVIRDDARATARVHCIYNGFDSNDFPPLAPPSNTRSCYRLVYVGTLWNLTSVEPLIRAVEHLAQRSPALTARLELVFAGRRTAPQQQLVDRLKRLPCRVVEHAYTDHAQAIDLLRSADGLCLLLTDVPGGERVVPAKLFEYMAAKRPIVAIAPPGEVWELLAEYPSAQRFRPAEHERLAAFLANAAECRPHNRAPTFTDWNGERYTRRYQTGQLADILEMCARETGPQFSGHDRSKIVPVRRTTEA